METLEELDWCLDQLETIQAHRSVGDMATSKFKRMLNKELSHFSETKSGSQISEYIFRTFLGKSLRFCCNFFYLLKFNFLTDKQEELDLPILQFEEGTGGLGMIKQSPVVGGNYSSGSAGMPSPMALDASGVVVGSTPASVAAASAAAIAATSLSGSKTSPARAMSHISGVRKAQLVHTNSLTSSSQLPRFGVETAHEEELGKIFEDMDKWGIDLFQVSEYSNRHPLTAIMYSIFRVSFLF